MNNIQNSDRIQSCLSLIRRSQEKNGMFLSVAGEHGFQKTKTRHTTFITSLILLALKEIQDTPTAAAVIKKGIPFLLSEKSDQWSWNYWQRTSEEARVAPYPDDFDDTCAALSALSLYSKKHIDGKTLAAVTQLLIKHEVKEGGPYNTWMILKPEGSWADVDVAVNATIAYFLSLHDIELPNLGHLFDTCIQKKHYISRYYFSSIPILYFISRVYKGSHTTTAIRHLKNCQKQGIWENPLMTALAVSALINFKAPRKILEKAIAYLADCVDKNAIKAEAIFIEEAKQKMIYSGSQALTAAYIAQALAKYEHYVAVEPTPASPPKADGHMMHKHITKMFYKKMELLSSDFKSKAKEVFDRITANDSAQQITLLPYYFYQALGAKKIIDDNIFSKLGHANVCGWVAYRVYDDILDSGAGINKLSFANVCAREVAHTYLSILPPREHGFFSHIMNAVDTANDWEQNHCRIDPHSFLSPPPSLPHYGNHEILAHKSLGHVLGPATILILLGYKSASLAVQHLLKAFTHYLIARQMNDDAHDWLTDLQSGFLNSASVRIFSRKHVARTEDELRYIFWEHVIPTITDDITSHIEKARSYFNNIHIVQETAYWEKLLAPIERSAHKASQERKHTRDFLKQYGKRELAPITTSQVAL